MTTTLRFSLLLAVLSGSALAAPEAVETTRPPSRFYFYLGAGVGFVTGTTFYDSGTNTLQPAFSLGITTTLGARLSQNLALGGALDFYLPFGATVVEDRSLGVLQHVTPAGVGMLLGPNLSVLGDRYHLTFTAGFFTLNVPDVPGSHNGNSYGGVGYGVSAGGGYDFPVGKSLAIGIEGRVLFGNQFWPADSSYITSVNFGALAFFTFHRR